MITKDAWVPLAEVARPHGVKGELRLRLYNKDSDVLLDLDEVLVRLVDGVEHEVSIDRARRADDAILMKLYSVDDRDRADELRGAKICVRRGDFPELEPGEFYACDVIGARVEVNEGDGGTLRSLGVVRDLMTYPSVDVLVVDEVGSDGTWEIPLVSAYIANVDAEAGVIFLRSLEGVERGVRGVKKKKAGA